MKKILLIIGLLSSFVAQSQIVKPVRWDFIALPIKGKVNIYEVRMIALIEKGWHIYSQYTSDGGPSATKVAFERNPMVLLGGRITEEGKMHKEHSEVFGVDVLSFNNKVTFVQIVKLKKSGGKTSLSGIVEFMACNAQQCLPPEEIGFNIDLK